MRQWVSSLLVFRLEGTIQMKGRVDSNLLVLVARSCVSGWNGNQKLTTLTTRMCVTPNQTTSDQTVLALFESIEDAGWETVERNQSDIGMWCLGGATCLAARLGRQRWWMESAVGHGATNARIVVDISSDGSGLLLDSRAYITRMGGCYLLLTS